jgi:hypothetical protein
MNDCFLKSNSLLMIVVLYVYSPKPFDMYIMINLKALDIITIPQTGSHRVNGAVQFHNMHQCRKLRKASYCIQPVCSSTDSHFTNWCQVFN